MTDAQRAKSPDAAFSSSLSSQVWEFGDLMLKSRFAQALASGVSRYPIHRSLRFAARIELPALFDNIALTLGWTAQRMDQHTMILESSGLFIKAYGSLKAEYCSCFFGVWAESIAVAEDCCKKILDLVGPARIREPMFSIGWHFLTSKGELEDASIEELADDDRRGAR